MKDSRRLRGLKMINKRSALSMLKNFGDAVIEFKDRHREPVACTLDFSNKYIKRVKRDIKQSLKGGILVFDWTNYKYDVIKVSDIWNITPMSDILQNVGPEPVLKYHTQFSKTTVMKHGD